MGTVILYTFRISTAETCTVLVAAAALAVVCWVMSLEFFRASHLSASLRGVQAVLLSFAVLGPIAYAVVMGVNEGALYRALWCSVGLLYIAVSRWMGCY